MIETDEDALICDLAEIYHIYDYKQLPPSKVAVFSIGLKEESRIKMAMNNQRVPLNTLLLAGISDHLATANWLNSKEGQEGTNRPQSILMKLLEIEPAEKENVSFESGEDFERTRNEMLEEMKRGEN